MLIATYTPLDELIPLIGASVGMLLALAFPSVIHILTYAPELVGRRHEKGHSNWPLVRLLIIDILILAIGVCCGVVGMIHNIRQIKHRYF